jgi:Zn-dependent protease with chaperone function
MTDELVALAQNDDEIIAVLAHEIGHVRGRHALRMILQSAGVAAITLAVFGDVSSTSALAAALPAVLLNAKHSREFEHEADGFAKSWLREHGIPERRFDDLLCRLEKQSPAGTEVRYLSSHPPTEERANCAAPAAPAAPAAGAKQP